jgi:thiamine pyrophosphokinase
VNPEESRGRDGAVAIIFLDGDYGDPAWYLALVAGADLVLAADGGARFLTGIGVRPAAVVGDFDSLDAATSERLSAEGVESVRHPVRKDLTDGELTVGEALRRGAGEVVLCGATGALDHTLGHLAVLRRLAGRGVPARLVAPGLSVTVLAAKTSVELDASAGVRVSLIPLDGDASVTLTGLDYLLDHGVLPADACLGIGNHVAEDGASSVAVHEGVVAVVVEADEEFRRRPSVRR